MTPRINIENEVEQIKDKLLEEGMALRIEGGSTSRCDNSPSGVLVGNNPTTSSISSSICCIWNSTRHRHKILRWWSIIGFTITITMLNNRKLVSRTLSAMQQQHQQKQLKEEQSTDQQTKYNDTINNNIQLFHNFASNDDSANENENVTTVITTTGTSSSSSSISSSITNSSIDNRHQDEERKQLHDGTLLSTVIETNTNWNNVHYLSGILNTSVFHNDMLLDDSIIDDICYRQTGVYGNDINPCIGPITNQDNESSCCYCYDEYPQFIFDSDDDHHTNNNYQQQWRKDAIQLFGGKNKIQTTMPILNKDNNETTTTADDDDDDDYNVYWFCAQQRETIFDINWSNLPKHIDVAIVTGKFGYHDKFQQKVEEHCHNILLIHNNRTTTTNDNSNNKDDAANVRVYCYSSTPSYILNDLRFQRHMYYRRNNTDDTSRGGGYWFHKALLVQYHMNQLPEDNNIKSSFVVWIDIDRLDFLQTMTLSTIIRDMEKRNKSDVTIETQPGYEYDYTKEDVLRAFNVSSSYSSSDDERYSLYQVNANAFVIRNTKYMKQFVNAYVDCVSDYHMISDEPSILQRTRTTTTTSSSNTINLTAHNNNINVNDTNKTIVVPTTTTIEEDGDHRHDQSILSLLVKRYLTKQYAVGPPAQVYQTTYSALHTYKYIHDDDNSDNDLSLLSLKYQQLQCPFNSFYKDFFLNFHKQHQH